MHGVAALLLVAPPDSVSFGGRLAGHVGGALRALVQDAPAEAPPPVVPILLAGWIAASLAAAPLAFAVLAALKAKLPLRRLLALYLGLALEQVFCFGLAWHVMGWGDRAQDAAVLAMSLLSTTMTAAWALELPLGRGLAHALGQAVASFVVAVAGSFALAELARALA